MKKKIINIPKIILLDLGGVVFQSTGESNTKINWEIISKLNYKYGFDLNIGEDLFPVFLKEYNNLSNQELEGKDFLKEVFDTLQINQSLINYLRLHSDIVIVSDNYRENIEYISDRYNFKDWSIREIYSFDYKMIKEDPKFFKRLLKELLPNKPTEMLFIDDSPEKIKSAEDQGVPGILFKNNEQVIKDFELRYKTQ